MITEWLEVRDEIVAFSEFGDVRCGTYMGRPVAVKTTRFPVLKDLQRIRKVSITGILTPNLNAISAILLQRFYREAVLWSTLSHPNVLELVGVQEDMERGQFVTVSEWMEHGTIMEYIESNHINRLELVRDLASLVTSFVQIAVVVARSS